MMRPSRLVWVSVSIFLMHWLMPSNVHVFAEEKNEERSPVVVELFTSEGCSSCPPADKLLETLRAENVLVLSFHVDYWNQLGWSDPFSSTDATLRQRQYAGLFKLDQVYTPQMIVSGESEFVGSNRKMAIAAISQAKRNRVARSLALEVKVNRGRLQIAYTTGNASKNLRLNLAIVQKSAVSKATTGENAGVRLPHVNVVRAFRTVEIDANKSGSAELEVPDGIEHDDLFVAGYLQDFSTGKIGAATMQPLR